MKNRFYWAVVGDGDPEPVGVEGEPGSRQAFTLGCADPYFIDEPDCPCRLLPELTQATRGDYYIAKVMDLEPSPMEVPENTLSPQIRKALEREFRQQSEKHWHGYAGFGRPSIPTLPRVTTPVAKLNRELFPGLDEQVAAIEEMKL